MAKEEKLCPNCNKKMEVNYGRGNYFWYKFSKCEEMVDRDGRNIVILPPEDNTLAINISAGIKAEELYNKV